MMEEAAFPWTGEGQKEEEYSFHALSKTCWILSLCMMRPSQPVKRADSAVNGTAASQMDINGCGRKGFMSHERLDGEQVRAVLVKVCAKSMAERMAGDTLRPAQAALMPMDVPGEEEGVDGLIPPGLLRKEVAHGTAAGTPVLCEDIQGCL